MEDSKKLDDKKWTTDSLKLAKLLHDQMRRLERKVMHDKDALGGFRCLGFLTAGRSSSTHHPRTETKYCRAAVSGNVPPVREGACMSFETRPPV